MIEELLIRTQKNDSRDIVSQCCACKQFVNKANEYILLTEEHIEEVYATYLVSHGYCEPCLNEWLYKHD